MTMKLPIKPTTLGAVLVAAAAVIGGVVFVAATHAQPAPGPAQGQPAAAVAAPDEEAPPSSGAPAATAAPSPNVRILFKLIPPGNATVTWGKKRLGVIKPRDSLTIHRPRDSGPLDVIFRSPGYLSVHTRAYTFTDSTVAVKMTPLDKKNTLYGYREELPPDGGAPAVGGPDGGVP